MWGGCICVGPRLYTVYVHFFLEIIGPSFRGLSVGESVVEARAETDRIVKMLKVRHSAKEKVVATPVVV